MNPIAFVCIVEKGSEQEMSVRAQTRIRQATVGGPGSVDSVGVNLGWPARLDHPPIHCHAASGALHTKYRRPEFHPSTCKLRPCCSYERAISTMNQTHAQRSEGVGKTGRERDSESRESGRVIERARTSVL